jgi:uncharacterized lipoprotein NlpE involved in copper resistance
MKKTILSLLAVATLTMMGCTEKGTMEHMNTSEDGLEVYKYYYDDGVFVFISRFKDQPNVETATWKQRHGKSTTTRGNIIIKAETYLPENIVMENDSMIVLRK